MSWWTYINGTINVSAPGRTQAECDYILQTVLDHLPPVTGSEHDMEIYINRSKYYKGASSCDEFDCDTENLTNHYGERRHNGWLHYQNRYTLTLQASLRDREFGETVREFSKWLMRLAKRMVVEDVFVRINGYEEELVINDTKTYREYYEYPSWCNDTEEPAWWEYLMWERWDNTPIPLEHVVKYYNDPEADNDWEEKLRRRR